MNTTHIPTLLQMAMYVSANEVVRLTSQDRQEAYDYIRRVLATHSYSGLRRPDKTTIRQYLMLVTGYSKAQIDRLIGQYVVHRQITTAERTQAKFPSKYTVEDIAELARIDQANEQLSGPATLAICKREYRVFGNQACIRLQDISVSHLYNLRASKSYSRMSLTYAKTKPTSVPIGKRTKPRPEGRPGFIRVDTVHQGDRDGEKGVYHINLVDEVTQWEVVIAVEGISERYMLPALEIALALFPFTILNFHSDNGSEYINQRVAQLLERLLGKLRQTKSRPRQSGDNGLVETKNGAVIRKALGYAHIPRTPANVTTINRWYTEWFVPWLNFHRPCAFRKTTVDAKTGKKKHSYPPSSYRTPYEALLDLDSPEQYLKPGTSLESLDRQAYTMSYTQWAEAMQVQKQAMWSKLKLH